MMKDNRVKRKFSFKRGRNQKNNPAYITVFKRVRNWQNQAPLEMGSRKLKHRKLKHFIFY